MHDIDNIKEGQRIKLVLRNRNYYDGEIIKKNSNTLIIRDRYGKRIHIDITEISELIDDNRFLDSRGVVKNDWDRIATQELRL